GLRVFAPVDAGPLARGLPRRSAHAAPSRGSCSPHEPGWRLHVRSRARRSRIEQLNSTQGEPTMQKKQVLDRAFAMPLTSPAYPPGPYRFVNREYLIIT